MRPEKAEHCDGFGYVLSWMVWLFCCLRLNDIIKYIVLKVDVGKKDKKESFSRISFCYGFYAWCLVVFLWVWVIFNEESCISK